MNFLFKMSKLTFEGYSQLEKPIKSLVENEKKLKPTLLDKKHWLTQEFQEDFFKRNKRFSSEENELMNDFIKSHKIEGERIFDKSQNKLKILSIKRVVNYLSIHPWMTVYDNKKIQLIREDIKTKFIRILFFNSFVVFPLFIIVNFRRAGIRSRHQITRPIIFRTLFYLAFFLLFQDLTYKKFYFFYNFNKRFQEDKIFKKYFNDYLKDDIQI
jgi:hypothetical protein